jgi:hypothetical protein
MPVFPKFPANNITRSQTPKSIKNKMAISSKFGLTVNQFYIQPATSGNPGSASNQSTLTADKSKVTLTEIAPGSTSQIWTFNDDGTLSPASEPTLVLTCNSTTSLQLAAPLSPPSPAQQFTYTNGSLTSSLNGSPLWLTVSGILDGQVSLSSTNDGAFTSWYLLPLNSIPLDVCFYIKTLMPNSTGDDATYVMTVPDSNTATGTQLVIDPMQEGALNQLWFVNSQGLFVSALDQSMALSTWPGGDLKVTIQPIGTTGELQHWYLYPNGILATGASGNNVFANVSGGGTASPGKEVISYNYEFQSNEFWAIVPYLPTGLWFTIQYEPADASKLLMTLANDGSLCLQPPLGQTDIPGGQASIVQLWKRTLAGNIICASLPNLAITASNGKLTLSPLVAGDAAQIFTWTNGQLTGPQAEQYPIGALANQGNVLSVQDTGGATIELTPLNQGTADTLWSVSPHAMPFEESTTLCNLKAKLFLTLDDKTAAGGGYQVNVGPISSDPTLSTWQYEYSGHIVNSADENIVLSLELADGSQPSSPVYGTNVVAYPRQPLQQLFQLWDISIEGLIVNRYNGQALSIPTPTSTPVSTAPAITTPISGTTRADYKNAYQVWDFSPGMALQTLLVQPYIGFPEWGDDSAQSLYSHISQLLGVPGGVRTQYPNLAAPINSFQSGLAMIGLFESYYNLSSHGITITDSEMVGYENIASQLNKEMTAVSAVQALFQQLTTLYLSLSQAQEMTLSELITACALPDGLKTPVAPPPPKKKRGWIGDLVEGLLYTGINLVAGKMESALFLPCVANLMATAFATYQGAQQSGSSMSRYLTALEKTEQNLYVYGMTVADLEQVLLEQFQSAGAVLGQIEAIILSDYYKLLKIFQMIKTTGRMSSLYWPANMTSLDADAMLTVYTSGVLKTLIPANAGFYIKATMHTNFGSLETKGWQDSNFYMDNGDQTQNMYSCTVNSEVMDIVWASGTKAMSFFRGLNGWDVPVQYQNVVNTNGFNGEGTPVGAGIVISVVNFTGLELTLNLNLSAMMGASYNYTDLSYKSVSLDIPAYGAQQFAGANMVMSWNDPVLPGSTETWYPWALMGPASGQGISIVVKSSQQAVMNTGVANSYDSGGTIPGKYSSINYAPTYTFPGLSYSAPFRGTVAQTTGFGGMVLVTITVSDL